MTTPATMPRQRVTNDVLAMLRHPGLVLAWRGDHLTLRIGEHEKTVNLQNCPQIRALIRGTA